MIRHTHVDGVPTVIAPTSGPMHAGLAFRVGRADETLAGRGITHLTEHLALHRLGQTDFHFNGVTGDVLTYFHMQGTDREITDFLTGVCASLRDLPMHRLETEKEILRTEAAGKGSAVHEPMAVWRYGAQGHGLRGYPEWGLAGITPDDLRAWVDRFFTVDNAMLWIAGNDVPPGLFLDLPRGTRQAVPTATSALAGTPAWFPGGTGAVAWDTVVRRSTDAAVFSGVLERTLFRRLRQEDGLSYTVRTDYDRRGDGFAVITAVADALPAKQEAMVARFVDVLDELRFGRVAAEDVQAVVGTRLAGLQSPDVEAATLPAIAFDMLTGAPFTDVAGFAAELRAVTPESVGAVAAEAWDGGLLMTPDERGAGWAGYVEAPSKSAGTVTGRTYPSVSGLEGRVVVGPQGVSALGRDEQDMATVLYADCVALLAWPDGARALIGRDAMSVRLEPTLHAGLEYALHDVDAAMSPRLKVIMPARDPELIPLPQQVHVPRQHDYRSTRLLFLVLWALVPVFGASAVFVGTMEIGAKDLHVPAWIRGVLVASAWLCYYCAGRVRQRLPV